MLAIGPHNTNRSSTFSSILIACLMCASCGQNLIDAQHIAEPVFALPACSDEAIAEPQKKKPEASQLEDSTGLHHNTSYRAAANDSVISKTLSGTLMIGNDNFVVPWCAATLIAPDIVLTAAHCFFFPEAFKQVLSAKPFSFRTQELEDGTPAVTIPILHTVAHPGYQRPNSAKDSESTGASSSFAYSAEDTVKVCGCPTFFDSDKSHAWFNQPLDDAMLDEEATWFACARHWRITTFGAEAMYQTHLVGRHDIGFGVLHPETLWLQPTDDAQMREAASQQTNCLLVVGGPNVIAAASPHPTGTALRQIQSEVVAVTESEFLLDNGTTTACSGDSGGGVFKVTANGPELVDVISRGESLPFSKRCIGYAAATSISFYEDWMAQTIRDARQNLK